jgi:hypothetical protein
MTIEVFRSLGPLSTHIADLPWPVDFFSPEDLPKFLDKIFVLDYRLDYRDDGFSCRFWLGFEGEVSVALPGLDGVRLVAGGGDVAGATFATVSLIVGQESALTLENFRLSIRFDPTLLTPAAINEGDPVPQFAEIRVEGSLLLDLSSFDLSVVGFDAFALTPVMIGNSGIIISAQDVKLDFSRTETLPEITAAGFDDSFIGVYIGEATVKLPDDFPSLASADLVLKKCVIGSGGVSGRLEAHYFPKYDEETETFTGKGAGTLFGIPFGLKDIDLEFKQNTFKKSEIKGEMLLPFFNEPVEVDIGISLDGGFTVKFTSTGPNGLKKLTKPKVLEIELDSIGFEVKGGVFLVKLSGLLTPLFGADKGLKWPGFKVEELSIDSKGNVILKGGWLALPKQQYLDFHGFKIGITKIGFGKTEDGGKWVGFCGELKLVDGFPAGASVEGLRVTWYSDPSKTKITIEGVGVEFEIPNVLYFKGHVAYQELDVGGASVHRFVGDIKMKLNALEMDIDAKLIIGSASGGPEGHYTFFAIYLAADLPTGIPLGSTPLALYGIDGLFALQMEPNKTESEEWYDDWYKKPTPGVTDLEKKWVNRRGTLALGGGVTIGTNSDNGFTFACKALLVIVFPGPIILLEGRANLLKERAKLKDDPTFRALAVLDMRRGQILIGLDAQYKRDWQTGRVVNIRAGAEAFFHTPNDWHIYLGKKETRDKRIRARFLSLFDADAYFMIEPKWLKTGIWVGYAKQWKFGPVRLTLEAWIEANVVVNWTPLHFHGDLWLHGSVEIKVFGVGLGLSVDARFEADVFDPFHVKASIEVSIKLPKPLKKKHVEITLEWGPIPDWPRQLPLPLKEIAIEHFKVTTSWPLPKDSTPPLLLPRYDPDKEGLRNDYPPPGFSDPPLSAMPVVPLDCRPHLSFGRSVHDDALVGVNPQPVQPEYERIGNPEANEGPVRVRYGLKEIELAKWDGQKNLWQAVASKPAVSGVPTLYGSWAAVPQLPSGAGQAPVANVKLWLWSKTPFDYTRHGGSDWDNWFIANFPNYPCVPQDIPDREVCFDFETLDSSQWLQSPWQLPQHPEITLGWQAPPHQHVTRLDPPVGGFTHALSFPAVVSACLPPPPADLSPPVLANTTAQPASGPTLPNTVTIKLSTPAKQVKLWVLESKPGQVCLNFRNREQVIVSLPHVEQGVTFGSGGTGPIEPSTTIEPIATTLGDMMGLICGVPTALTLASITITLPCPGSAVELMLTYQEPPGFVMPPKIEAFDSAGAKVNEKTMLNPTGQPEIVRFEGSDLKKIRINSGNVRVFLHELCFLCPDSSSSLTATAFDAKGKQIGVFVNQGNVVEIRGKDLSSVQVNSNSEIRLLKICTVFGPDPKELAHRQEMEKHLQSEVTRWSKEGEVLEPFSAYRLKIVTTIDAYGEHPLSGSKNLTQTEYAYFRTEGPPGLTKLSLPVGRDPKDADKFDSGLEDLTRYVRQTMPATIPAVGEKPVMAKPFYRAYDIGVEFNEDYVDLMYRISGRDLGLYIYDSNNRPTRDVDGRLLVQSGDWGAVEELTLTEGAQRWLALSNSENRCLPVISTETIAHDKKFTSAVPGRVFEPDMIHEARLVPLLLREGFQKYAAGAVAPGPSGKLGRLEVLDDGNVNSPSHWVVGETVAPVGKYITQTSSIKGGNDDANDPVKPGTILLFADDPGLDSGHREQPTIWTDYRLSVYLSAAGGGAMGLVFHFRDGNNYYRFSMDRNRKYRRIVTVADGIHNILKQDAFAYELQHDYLITIEVIGDAFRIFQDGALIFDVTDETHRNGSIGLYCYDNPAARFSDVRVDDFRQTAQVVYRFQFTTSRFANFFHHLHSYQDETWRAAVAGVPGVYPAMSQAVKPTAPLTDDEVRAYETLASTVLGPAARQNPPEVQVTRVEIDGAPLAFLVQSSEPIDWLRTEIALSRTGFARTEPALPAKAKLAAVNFAANRIDIDSVVLLLREPMDLSAYRIEGRLVSWPLSPGSGVVIDAQTIPGGLAGQSWATYRLFEAEKKLSAGTILQVQPGDALPITPAGLAGVDAEGVPPAHRILYSIELRLVAPDGEIVHSRHFLPGDDYVSEYPKVLRKADGTGFFMVKLDVALNVVPLSLAQYRLKLTYHRNNKARVSTSRTLSQAGNDADEIVTLDIPLQTQD